MTHVVVTVEIDSQTRFDLALPLDVPNHALANAVAQALEVDNAGKGQYALVVKTERGVVRISSQSTLGDASVLDGFYLQLVQEKDSPSSRRVKSQAYLETETGQVFPLDAETLIIGRKDVKRGVLVDIDLTPLDSRKIVSRKHAVLKQEKGQWTLTDQGSVNGTWLNGHQLTARESYPLQGDDEIMFGRNGVILKYRSIE
ncbi:MAG: FHA domain-containing protein [Chloroflexota bacterium]